MILPPYSGTTNMDSLYCTNPNPTGAGGGNYVRAQGFAAFASYGGTGTGTFANGAVHVQEMFDESSFSYIMSQFQGADSLWDFTDGTYAQHSSLSVRRALYRYGSWGSVTKVEVSKSGLDQYVDVYVSSTSSFSVTVIFIGASIPSAAIVTVPVVGATPPSDGNAAAIDLTQLPQSRCWCRRPVVRAHCGEELIKGTM